MSPASIPASPSPEPSKAPEHATPAEPATPPDPAAYDHPRAVQARARGLAAPYIPGGRDPEPEVAEAEERRYLRLLVAMILVLIFGGFVLGIVQNLLRGAGS
jgi:hypothetical protein